MTEPVEAPAEAEPEETPEVELPMPTNVHEAIRRVMMDLGGIPKMTGEMHRARSGIESGGDREGVNYAYRAVDQITGDAQPLFGLYGCVWTPKVLEIEEVEFQINNRPWVDVKMKMLYWVVGPGGAKVVFPITKHFDEDGTYTEGPDFDAWYMEGDCMLIGPLYAVGRDNSDKGRNKAMTQGFKQALLQTLSIGDPTDDGDHEKHESERQPERSGPRVITDEMAAEFKRKVAALPKDLGRELVDQLKVEVPVLPEMMSSEEFGKANQLLHLFVVRASQGDNGSAVDSAVVNPTEPEATDDERAEAMAFLREMIEAVPEVDEAGASQRMLLTSNLRGLYGPSEDMTYDQILAATVVASHWPDPVPEERQEPEPVIVGADGLPEPQEPAAAPPSAPEADGDAQTPAAAPSGPETPLDLLRQMVGDGPSDALLDEVLAEVAGVKGPERKEQLRERNLPLTGTVSELGYRLATAIARERHEAPAGE